MNRIPVLTLWLLAAALAAASGCNEIETELGLDDLSADESRYVTRIVVLERAKAVALIDRKAGNALLDSLSAAWGDSALDHALVGVPTDPHRSSQVHGLLARILKAERDSLHQAARPDRLDAPLPEALPDPPPGPPQPGDGKS